MNFTKIAVLAVEGDGGDLFGGGEFCPKPDQLGCGREEGVKEALGDDPTWMLRWHAAIFPNIREVEEIRLWFSGLRVIRLLRFYPAYWHVQTTGRKERFLGGGGCGGGESGFV